MACITRLERLREPVVLRPLPGFLIIRDLMVDMTNFFELYHSTSPHLANDEAPPDKERLPSPAERERLNGCPKGLEPSHAIKKIRLLMAKLPPDLAGLPTHRPNPAKQPKLVCPGTGRPDRQG